MRRLGQSTRRAVWACAAAVGVVAAGCSTSPTAAPPAGSEPQGQAVECVLAPDTAVVDLTYDELARYELNNGEPIPTLEQFLDLANDAGVGVLPEIKTFAATPGTEPPPPSAGQLEQFATMVADRPDIPEVLIGSFNGSVLEYFAASNPDWTRVWFRGVGGQDPFRPPTVDEMRTRAPSANALGVLNVLYGQGTSPLDGQVYDVPADFATAGIAVYVWFNVITGGDSAQGGEATLGYDESPGWDALANLAPANIAWIATDNTAEYAQWARALPAGGPVAPAMVAHRGGGTEAISENSLQAFRQAVADGATVLETDVQWTRPTPDAPNGVPVLMHDATVNRTVRCPR